MANGLKVAGQVTRALAAGVVDSKTSLSQKLELLGGFTASGLRLARGMTVGKLGPRPELPLRLWDFERCPHCRIVREALTALDLEVEVRPCPRGGTRFRPELKGPGVPQLEDPNTGVHLVGSTVIVKYLYDRYGAGAPPGFLNTTPVRVATGLAARVLTFGRGGEARPSRAPEKPLELYAFEASPYSRFARLTLCELELPYLLHNVGKGSKRRRAFVARSGKMQVPWLHDPNTGWEGFESRVIQRYLEDTYGAQ